MDEIVGKKFLDLFPPLKRTGIMNQFLTAVRGNAKTPGEVLERVRSNASHRLSSDWITLSDADIQRILTANLGTDDAINLAMYCLWWESLSSNERQRIKDKRGTDYRAQAMAVLPPSNRQLDYLERLGCNVKPATMNEASKLINEWKGKSK